MNAPLPPDPYKALGVDTSADAASIKTAYRKLVLRCHPDKVLDPTLKAAKQEEFQRVQQAYEILSDEDKRREYDLEVKARKLREELYKNGPATATPPKKYYNVNIRTAEPPASFAAPQPPPPTKGYSPYPQPQFSHSWESRDMPHRSKAAPFEEKTTRRAASYEKPKREEDSKEERRRRKDEDRERERERERREDRERERERERERDRDEYLKEKRREEEKDRRREEKRELQRREEKERQRLEDERRAKDIAKAEKKRAEREREKERDKARKRDQEEKHRSKSKPAYVEPYSDPDEEVPVKTIKKSSSSSKKHAESPPRDKSSRRERDRSTPRVGREEIMVDKLAFAADYMDAARRKVSKVPPASPYHEAPMPTYPSPSYPDPEAWHASTPRRGSHDAKYAKAEPVIIDAGSPMHKGPDGLSTSPRGEPHIPSLRKSYTSPVGTMPQAPAPAPRIPTLGRAQTMQPDYGRDRTPQVPAAPLPEKYAKHERRRRNSYDDYPEEMHDLPPRSSGHHRSGKGLPQSNVKVYYVEKEDVPRVTERYPDDSYYSGGGGFPKVKVAQQYRPDQVYTAKRFTENDVRYSDAPHTAASYSQQYAY